jgi:hypothetical protein
MLPPSSGAKSKLSKKPARAKTIRRLGGSEAACCLLHPGFLLCFLFDLEDGGDMFFRIFVSFSPDYTASSQMAETAVFYFQVRDQLRAVVNTVMNIRVWEFREYLSDC